VGGVGNEIALLRGIHGIHGIHVRPFSRRPSAMDSFIHGRKAGLDKRRSLFIELIHNSSGSRSLPEAEEDLPIHNERPLSAHTSLSSSSSSRTSSAIAAIKDATL